MNKLLQMGAFTLGATVLSVTPMPSSGAPPKFDLDNITAYRLALESSTDPESAVIREEIANGPKDLADAKAAALKDGIPLTVSVKPLPPDENAVPLYMQWSALRDKLPYPMYADPMTLRNQYTPAQIAEVQKLVDDNKAPDELLMEAIGKPAINPYDSDPLVDFPVQSRLRAAARQVQTEASLLALKGQWRDAVQMQVKGFAIQKQVEEQPSTMSYMVAYAIESITISGLQDLLDWSKPDAEVAAGATRGVSVAENAHALKYALTSDAACFIGMYESSKKGITTGAVTDLSKNSYTPEDRRLYEGVLDAAEARYLTDLRYAVDVADEPPMQRRRDMAELVKSAEIRYGRITNDPVTGLFVGLALSRQLVQNDDRRTASEQITLAAAAVLSAKATVGAFPTSLPGQFVDPFSGASLVYKQKDSGFEIYSVGPTGHFDGKLKGGRVPKFGTLFQYPGPPLLPLSKDALQHEGTS